MCQLHGNVHNYELASEGNCGVPWHSMALFQSMRIVLHTCRTLNKGFGKGCLMGPCKITEAQKPFGTPLMGPEKMYILCVYLYMYYIHIMI